MIAGIFTSLFFIIVVVLILAAIGAVAIVKSIGNKVS